jgi:hypothetical protein
MLRREIEISGSRGCGSRRSWRVIASSQTCLPTVDPAWQPKVSQVRSRLRELLFESARGAGWQRKMALPRHACRAIPQWGDCPHGEPASDLLVVRYCVALRDCELDAARERRAQGQVIATSILRREYSARCRRPCSAPHQHHGAVARRSDRKTAPCWARAAHGPG